MGRLINGLLSQDATQNSLPSNPSRSHILGSRASSADEVAIGRSVINGSTDERDAHSPTSSARRDNCHTWAQSLAPDSMMDGLDTLSIDGSLSLSGSSVSDGLRDTGNPPARSELRDTNPGRLARISEYEAPVNGSHFSKPSSTACPSPRTYLLTDNDTGIMHEPPECSECDSILKGIKYVCTTCAAAEEKGKNREASASPTRTVLDRRLSGSSSSTARASYELCATCFERVGIDHSSQGWCSTRETVHTTRQELAITRRSPPKQKGQLCHAFVEKIWGDHGWQVVGAQLHFVTCIPASKLNNQQSMRCRTIAPDVNLSCQGISTSAGSATSLPSVEHAIGGHQQYLKPPLA
jgi:hypothetical protein